MNERIRDNRRNNAQQVVEYLRHRALQSPQAERLAEYVANKFKTTGCYDIKITWEPFSRPVDKETMKVVGHADVNRLDLWFKRENNRYYVQGGCVKEWTDVTDTDVPCKYATDSLDLMEKYFILSSLGYIVKLWPTSIEISLPQVDYINYVHA